MNHFVSADTIIADQYNPQNLNRYSYVINNPLKYTDPSGHMQVCERGEEGEEGILHSSRCGSGANMEQIAKAFDEDHGGKGYSIYYAKIHGVKQSLDEYLENIKTDDENETYAMYHERISVYEHRLRASVEDAKNEGLAVHSRLDQHAWKSKAEFPKILGGGYVVDHSSASLGGDFVSGSAGNSSVSIPDIVSYYTRTPVPLFFPRDDWMHNP